MIRHNRQAPGNEPAEKTAVTSADETETDGNDGENEKKQPEKLTGKQVTAGLIALAGLLLVFFIGMRWIDGRSAKLTPPDLAAETQAAPDRALLAEGRININTASLPELKELPGIGDKKAQAVIDYRNEYGPFTSIEEIMRVDGIGEAIFNAIRDDICV